MRRKNRQEGRPIFSTRKLTDEPMVKLIHMADEPIQAPEISKELTSPVSGENVEREPRLALLGCSKRNSQRWARRWLDHYAALLRDLMGEDGQVVVEEDRIECSDSDGLTVTISPSSGHTTAAVTAVGKLSRRLLGSTLPLVIPGLFGLMVVRADEDIGFGMFFGVLMAAVVSVVGGIISHRREQKALRKKSEQVRRQLQRMLDTLPDKP